MSLLYRCKGSKKANYGRTIFKIDEGNCQREDKQQQSCDFVHRAVNCNKLLLNDKSGNDIDNFYQSYDAYPNI